MTTPELHGGGRPLYQGGYLFGIQKFFAVVGRGSRRRSKGIIARGTVSRAPSRLYLRGKVVHLLGEPIDLSTQTHQGGLTVAHIDRV